MESEHDALYGPGPQQLQIADSAGQAWHHVREGCIPVACTFAGSVVADPHEFIDPPFPGKPRLHVRALSFRGFYPDCAFVVPHHLRLPAVLTIGVLDGSIAGTQEELLALGDAMYLLRDHRRRPDLVDAPGGPQVLALLDRVGLSQRKQGGLAAWLRALQVLRFLMQPDAALAPEQVRVRAQHVQRVVDGERRLLDRAMQLPSQTFGPFVHLVLALQGFRLLPFLRARAEWVVMQELRAAWIVPRSSSTVHRLRHPGGLGGLLAALNLPFKAHGSGITEVAPAGKGDAERVAKALQAEMDVAVAEPQ